MCLIIKSFYQSKPVRKPFIVFILIASYSAGSPKDSEFKIIEFPKWVYAGKVENAEKK